MAVQNVNGVDVVNIDEEKVSEVSGKTRNIASELDTMADEMSKMVTMIEDGFQCGKHRSHEKLMNAQKKLAKNTSTIGRDCNDVSSKLDKIIMKAKQVEAAATDRNTNI